MATQNRTVNFRISAEAFERFRKACEDNSTYYSTVLRDFCEDFPANQAKLSRTRSVSDKKKQLGLVFPSRIQFRIQAKRFSGLASFTVDRVGLVLERRSRKLLLMV